MLLIAYRHATGAGGMQKYIVFYSQKSSSVDELNEKNTVIFQFNKK
jgi:hypothetical protein